MPCDARERERARARARRGMNRWNRCVRAGDGDATNVTRAATTPRMLLQVRSSSRVTRGRSTSMTDLHDRW